MRTAWSNGFYAEEIQSIPLTKEELVKLAGEIWVAALVRFAPIVDRNLSNRFGKFNKLVIG